MYRLGRVAIQKGKAIYIGTKSIVLQQASQASHIINIVAYYLSMEAYATTPLFMWRDAAGQK